MSYKYDPAIAARKRRNAEVFEETMKICRDGFYVSPSGKKVTLPTLEEVADNSRFYVAPEKFEGAGAVEKTEIDAVNADCINVARELVEGGYKPVVLNMANRHTPGGGVLGGARAQEETLFRRSNLCASLYRYDEYHADLIGVKAVKTWHVVDDLIERFMNCCSGDTAPVSRTK